MYNGEIEDSNSNYFVLRLADHAQFFAFNNKTDKVNLFFGVSTSFRLSDSFRRKIRKQSTIRNPSNLEQA